MIKVEQITDLSSGVYAITGPCSMSSPCPGPSCPTHGTRQPDEPTEATDPTVEIAYLKATIADLKTERYQARWDLEGWAARAESAETELAQLRAFATVGQLSAAHVGQLVRIDGQEHVVSAVEHFWDGTSVRCAVGERFTWRRFESSTPCQVVEGQ